MDQLWEEVQKLAESLLARLHSAWKSSPPGSIEITGLLGVAALLAGIYHWRQNRRVEPRGGEGAAARRQQQQSRGPQGLTANKPEFPPLSEPGSHDLSKPVPLRSIRSQLAGVKTVTLSVPGVLLQERDPSQLEEGAFVINDAAEVVKELASCLPLYLLAQVSSDIGEAVVRGALESANVLGTGPRQVPPHRLILCDTLGGKVAIVRQIEPELHIDGDHRTLSELQRFIPQQLQIYQKGDLLAAGSKGIIGHGLSLPEALNVAV